MKLAIFKNIACNFETTCEPNMEGHGDYVRLTEYVDVEFQRIKGDEVIEQQINILNRAETDLRNKFQEALNKIDRQRAELLALPNLEMANVN